MLLGRGSGASNHLGNIKFRFFVNQYKDRYAAASRVDKPKVAQEVVNMWRNLTPPGRFLARYDEEDDDGNEDDEDYTAGRWRDVGNSRAKTKTCQCLRGKKTFAVSTALCHAHVGSMISHSPYLTIIHVRTSIYDVQKRKGPARPKDVNRDIPR